MPPSRDDVIRVGLRLVIVALVAGLLVLLFNPAARSAEPSLHEALLLEPTPLLTPAERVERAEHLLRSEKRRRASSLAAHVVDLGVRAALQASPRRLLRGVRDVARDVWTWRDRSPAEDRAMQLLEAEHRAGVLGDSGTDLYTSLRARERADHAERLRAQAETALAQGRTWRARRALDRLLALDGPGAEIEGLLAGLEAAERQPLPAVAAEAPLRVDRFEVTLSAALLADRHATVETLADARHGARRDADLAAAVARFLAGERAEGLAAFAKLAERDDAVGALAERWLADPDLNPELVLDRELARYRRQQKLGWVGGSDLAESGLGFDASAYAAWSEAASPVNLIISAPSRILRGWHPDSAGLRRAAERYVSLLPDGPRAAEARDWIERLPLDARSARGPGVWDDGVLVLPAARTGYARGLPQPILVTLGALTPARRLELGLGVELQGADAVLLTLAPDADVDVLPLPSDEALALIGELAAGLEDRSLRTDQAQGRTEVLEALRKLDTGVRHGWQVAAEPWIYVDRSETTVSLQRALDPGTEEAPSLRERLSEGVDLVRGRKDVRISRPLLQAVECPADTWCIDRTRRVEGDVFARVEVDGDVRLGASTRFADASLGLELSDDGPAASLSLPLARWLGLAHWIPVEASVAISLDGVSFGTRAMEEPEAAVPASMY